MVKGVDMGTENQERAFDEQIKRRIMWIGIFFVACFLVLGVYLVKTATTDPAELMADHYDGYTVVKICALPANGSSDIVFAIRSGIWPDLSEVPGRPADDWISLGDYPFLAEGQYSMCTMYGSNWWSNEINPLLFTVGFVTYDGVSAADAEQNFYSAPLRVYYGSVNRKGETHKRDVTLYLDEPGVYHFGVLAERFEYDRSGVTYGPNTVSTDGFSYPIVSAGALKRGRPLIKL